MIDNTFLVRVSFLLLDLFVAIVRMYGRWLIDGITLVQQITPVWQTKNHLVTGGGLSF